MRNLLLLLLLPGLLFAQAESKLGSILTVKQAETVKQPAGMVYRASKGTKFSQTFQDAEHFYRGEYDKGTFQTIISPGVPLCYEDSGKMKRIDLSEKPAKSKGYQKGYQIAQSFFELDSLCNMLYTKNGDTLWIHPLFAGVKATFEPQPQKMKATYFLEESGPDSLAWTLTDPHGLAARKIPPFTALDAAGNPVALIETRTSTSLSVKIKDRKSIKGPVAIDPTVYDTAYADKSAFLEVAATSGLSTWTQYRNRTASSGAAFAALGGRVEATDNGVIYQGRLAYSFPMNDLSTMASIDSARFYWKSASFNVYPPCAATICEGTFSGAPDTTWYNDFRGWAASGAYTVNALSDDSLTIAATSTLYSVALNDSGKALIVRTAGADTMRVMMLENSDKINVGDTGVHSFATSDGTLPPYLKIFYQAGSPSTAWSKKVAGIVPSKVNGIVPTKVLGIQ